MTWNVENYIVYLGISTFGKNAVVCGRSKNVGMPIAMLLHADNAGKAKKKKNINYGSRNNCNLSLLFWS